VWDYENRLLSRSLGITYTFFSYRGDGLRESSTVRGGARMCSPGTLRAQCHSCYQIPRPGTSYRVPIRYGNGRIASYSGATPTYYLTDGLGSTIATVNSAGGIQASQSYDIYGAQSSGGTPPGGFGFAGEQSDGTGLPYLRARYYDPSIGRFISRDPMSAQPGWTGSPYGYGGGNPVNATDPTGLGVDWGCDDDCDDEELDGEDDPDFACPGQTNPESPTDLGLLGGLGGGGCAGSGSGGGGGGGSNRVAQGAAAEAQAGIKGPKVRVQSAFDPNRKRIPDAYDLDAGTLTEVKNVKNLSFTRQLRDYAAIARRDGLTFTLKVGGYTRLSGPLQAAINSGLIQLVRLFWR
jgi:RHS repeat-associated protein